MAWCEKKEANEQNRPLRLLPTDNPQSARRASKRTLSFRHPGSAEKPHRLYLFRDKPSCQQSLRFAGGMSQNDLKQYYNLIDRNESSHSSQSKDRSKKKKKHISRQTCWYILRQISTRIFLREDEENLAETTPSNNCSKVPSRSESYTRFSVRFYSEVHVCFIPHAADYPEHVRSSCWFSWKKNSQRQPKNSSSGDAAATIVRTFGLP